MPAFCTHYLFGEDFIVDLPIEQKHNINFRNSFFYGVQGPDFLLFHRALPTMMGKSLRRFSTRMHTDPPAKLFAVLQKLQRLNPDNDFVNGYVAGFVCHYALDRAAHPYINFLQEGIIRKEKAKFAPTIHNRIETNIDRYMLKARFKINDPRKFHPSEILTDDPKTIQNIASIIVKVLSSVYDFNVKQSEICTAFRDFRKIEEMLSDSNYWEKTVARFAELPVRSKYGPALSALIRSGKTDKRWDYVNAKKNPWVNVDNREQASNMSFIEIYDSALQSALTMYNGLLEGIDAAEFTGNISFKTGAVAKQ